MLISNNHFDQGKGLLNIVSIALTRNFFFELRGMRSALFMLLTITRGCYPRLFIFSPFRAGSIELQAVAVFGIWAVV